MRNDFDDAVSTTNDALSVVCGWSVFFYALLLLFLSLSFVCVCVCMCVYVCIYITTIRVPSFPLRSFPKGSRVQPKCGVKDENLKYEFMNSRVCVCVCVARFSLSLWFGGVVTFSSLLSFFGFLDVFFPPRAAFETSSKSRSLSLACCRGSLSTRTLFARREDRQTLFAQREREREFLAAEEEFSRERRD